MYTQMKKVLTALVIALSFSGFAIQNAQAASAEEISYDGATVCAALFIADANLENQAGNQENVDLLIDAAVTLLSHSYALTSKTSDEVDNEVLGYAEVLIAMQDTGEYQQIINEYGDMCVEMVVSI